MRISDWSSDVCSSDLGRAGRDLVARILGVAGEHAGRLAGAADALDAFYRLGFGLGVRRLAQIAHRRRPVGRTDEQGIDAVDRGDLLDPTERFARLDLHHRAQLFVDAVDIFANRAASRRPNGDPVSHSDPPGRHTISPDASGPPPPT